MRSFFSYLHEICGPGIRARRRSLRRSPMFALVEAVERRTLLTSVFVSDQWFAESDGSTSFYVASDMAVPSDLAVTYTVTSGSATAGMDFIMSSGTVVIPLGAMSATIGLTIVDDTDGEPQESFFVQIDSTSYGTILQGLATAFIDDDDGVDGGSAPTAVAATGVAIDTDGDGVKDTYNVDSGRSLNLDGTDSSDPDADPLTYKWDLDDDITTWEKTGATPSVTREELTAMGYANGDSFSITLQVEDGNGGVDQDMAMVVLLKPAVSITAVDAEAAEGYNPDLSADPGSIRIERHNTDLGSPLTVGIWTTGTAVTNIDYSTTPGTNWGASTVVIPASQSSLTLVLNPIQDDKFLEGTETAQFTIVPLPEYDITGPIMTSVAITDVNRPPVMNDQVVHIVRNKTGVITNPGAVDPDTGQMLTYSMTPHPNFTIDNSSGDISVANPSPFLSLTADATFSLNVTVFDNGTPSENDSAVITVVVHALDAWLDEVEFNNDHTIYRDPGPTPSDGLAYSGAEWKVGTTALPVAYSSTLATASKRLDTDVKITVPETTRPQRKELMQRTMRRVQDGTTSKHQGSNP